jgi:hypothetical protein
LAKELDQLRIAPVLLWERIKKVFVLPLKNAHDEDPRSLGLPVSALGKSRLTVNAAEDNEQRKTDTSNNAKLMSFQRFASCVAGIR